jgi:hypothetical protein
VRVCEADASCDWSTAAIRFVHSQVHHNRLMTGRSIVRLGAILGLAGLLAGCGSSESSASPGAPIATSLAGATNAASTPSAAISAASSVAATAPGATSSGSPAITNLGRAAKPVGLIAVGSYVHPTAGQHPTPIFPTQVLTNRAISGVQLYVKWSDIEPGPDQFNWQITDELFQEAGLHDKFVVLTFVPGFATPQWARKGVIQQFFSLTYGSGLEGYLPLPWDATYLARWDAFLEAVAARYGNNPQFRMISAAGPTSVSEEMSLPYLAAGDPALPAPGSDLAAWVALGYTPGRYEAAWAQVFQVYARLFPRQYISFALYAGLAIPDASQKVTTLQTVFGEGERSVGADRFVFQGDGLTYNNAGANSYEYVKSEAGLIGATGLQLARPATTDPAKEGGPADAGGTVADEVAALQAALNRGLAANVDFLEVYQADVVNPAMQGVLQATQAELAH